MKKSLLQIPIDHTLRKQAELVAEEEGFSSLQEYIRVLIKKIVMREFTLQVTETPSEEDQKLILELADEDRTLGRTKPPTPAAFERRLNELKRRKAV